jgi:predicted ATPase/class 3 adenylate cyclase
MPDLPSGVITFLFTDIESSTQRWERQREAMALAVARHDTLIREAIAAHGGHVFQTAGDAFSAAFTLPGAALAAALAAQRALQAEPWAATGPLLVRMALHTGPAEVRDGEYFGPPTLNRLSRLLGVAYGGQVLLTAATAALVAGALPPGGELRDLGARRLRDLIEAEHVYQLVAPGLRADFPPLKTLDAHPSNLPAQPTALIGREAELITLRALLRGAGRLVTCTGPGGTGKTRLALQAAADVLDYFPDGVWFVALAPISDPALVLPTIAAALRVKEEPARPLRDTLRTWLADRRLLLLLDNFEQVLDAAAAVSALLRAAPGLTVLVTSRTLLHLYGEHAFPVPPLQLPGPDQVLSPDALGEVPAIALFLARARAANPGVTLSAGNAAAVAAICARLDGLPLALELAAARTRLLAPAAILAQLDHRLALLTGGPRDLPARQQTLRGAIDWSYDLLDPAARTLFARLAVFVGGGPLSAVAAVTGDGDGSAAPSPALTALVDQSLVRLDDTGEADPRFTMLETIREYAAERLEDSGGADAVRARHAATYLALAQACEQAMFGPGLAAANERLEREHDNLRAALSWVVGQGDADAAVRLAGVLGRFWWSRGYLQEGRQWLRTVLALPGPVPAAERVKALNAAGLLAHTQGDFAEAVTLLEERLALQRTLGDRLLIGGALINLGMVVLYRGDYDRAAVYYEEGAALARETGDTRLLAVTLHNLAGVRLHAGDYARAAGLYAESLEQARALGDPHAIAASLSDLGWVDLGLGDPAAASAHFTEALTTLRDLGDRIGVAACLEGLAAVAVAVAQPDRAARLLGAAAAVGASIGATVPQADPAAYARAVAAGRAALSPAAWDAAWAAGQALSLDAVYAYALRLGAGAG